MRGVVQMAIHDAECNIEAHSKLSAIWTVTHGHTGREILGAAGYALADEWAHLETKEEMRAHPAFLEFLAHIVEAPRLTDCALQWYRRVCFPDGETPRADQMGPPPSNKFPQEGRYNEEGQRMLYLTDSEDGVRCELQTWPASGSPFAQCFRLPLQRLNVADFTAIPAEHFVAAVFAKAEECKVEGRGPDSYVFSQLVARCVMMFCDGMRMPGVHGLRSHQYSNLVIFHPEHQWKEWLEGDPYCLVKLADEV